MKNFSVRFILLFAVLSFYVNIVNAEDIKMYDDCRYTGVMKETSSGYRMYDSSGTQAKWKELLMVIELMIVQAVIQEV